MCDRWMPVLRLPLTADQFHTLPRNPAYKYEYINGQAILTPRSKIYHAVLDLDRFALPDDLPPAPVARLRNIGAEDWENLQAVFTSSLHGYQPFASIDRATMKTAAHDCLEFTRTGGDGPLVEAACLVAEDNKPLAVGGILITLLPPGNPSDFESYYWREPAAENAVAERLGRPHLTWVFVHPRHARSGIGTALLDAAVGMLRQLGFNQLYSTFMLGNESSMTWHWRHGFQLLSYPGSMRRVRLQLGRGSEGQD